jgi:uncharacterized protein YbbK (DUF523 family)
MLAGKPRVGVSACLLGQAVRYNGGHKRDALLLEILGPHVEWLPVCPEMELGMGTPRPPIRLQRRDEAIRLVMPSTGSDYTDAMREYAERRVEILAEAGLDGYVLKQGSPSCGMENVEVHGDGDPSRDGRGLFAEVLIARLPLLPVEEEGRLGDPLLRDGFMASVFDHYRRRTGHRFSWLPLREG